MSVVREVSRRRGVLYVVYSGITVFFNRLFLNRFWLWYYRRFKASTFTFQGNVYSYFYHGYNTTWNNERAVEIPIIWSIVKKYDGKNILEVGNVLSHYFQTDHDVLDRYEKADGIINQDVTEFQSTKRYNLVVSISTLEHVGWDEEPKEPVKFLRAIENLRNLLTPDGIMVTTVPLGYNPTLDEFVFGGKLGFSGRFCLKRISKDNRWIEVSCDEVHNARFGCPFNSANGLVVTTFERD